MDKGLLVILLFVFSVHSCPNSPDIPRNPTIARATFAGLQAKLDALVSSLTPRMGTGIAVSLTYGSNVSMSSVAGPAVKNPTDTFGIGSQTKLFSTTIMWMFKERGWLQLDDLLVQHLNITLYNPYTGRQSSDAITMAQLASHSAGLPRECPCDICSRLPVDPCNLTDDQVASRLRNESLILPPGQKPNYSNLGFAILGNALLSIAQKHGSSASSYAELVRQFLLDPLGMPNTGILPNASLSNLVLGEVSGNPAPICPMGWCAPAGAGYSNTQDMSVLLSFLSSSEHSDLLSAETKREMMHFRFVNDDAETGFGMPWEFLFERDVNMWARRKGGLVLGYNSELGIYPSIETAITVLTNMGPGYAGQIYGKVASLAMPELVSQLKESARVPQLPPFAKSLPGIYTATPNLLPIHANITVYSESSLRIEVTTLGSTLFRSLLNYENYSRWRTAPFSDSSSCSSLQGGFFNQIVEITFPLGQPRLTAPGILYGMFFHRTSM